MGTFKKHVKNTNTKAQNRLNTHRASTTYGKSEETLTTVYNQFIMTTLDYTNMTWAPDLHKHILPHQNAYKTKHDFRQYKHQTYTKRRCAPTIIPLGHAGNPIPPNTQRISHSCHIHYNPPTRHVQFTTNQSTISNYSHPIPKHIHTHLYTLTPFYPALGEAPSPDTSASSLCCDAVTTLHYKHTKTE